jgi:hypothetical protein
VQHDRRRRRHARNVHQHERVAGAHQIVHRKGKRGALHGGLADDDSARFVQRRRAHLTA